jgi:murein DD-endopeptidase MepM/ murein hydrolase activator NlpD
VGGILVAFFATGCASLVPARSPSPPAVPLEDLEIDDDLTELLAMMRHDWAILSERQVSLPSPSEPINRATPKPTPAPPAPKAITPDRVLASLYMPVAGVTASQLANSYGAPRDGGRRKHRGIDIKAPRGTKVVAVADGEISYVGTQNKAGRSVWLVTEAGVSFFYAHLDRWANGIREGQKVRKGDTLGYVGNSGNARRSAPHLHFTIHRYSEAINPYDHLLTAMVVDRAPPVLAGGLTAGGQ